MALIRQLFQATYTSGTSTQQYQFTIVVEQSGLIAVRDIRTPFGSLCDSLASLPSAVVADILTAQAQVEDLLGLTSDITGTVTFTNEVSQAVVFATPLVSATYGVSYTVEDFVEIRTTNRTTTGFTIEASVTYTGTVRFDVFI